MKQQVVRVSVGQTSKVVALLYGALGLLFVPIGLIFAILDTDGQFGGRAIAAFYLCAPFFYAVIGYITSLFIFWIYNLIAGGVGGIEFELSNPEAEQASSAMSPQSSG